MPLEKKAAVSQCRLHGTPDEYLKQQEVDLTQEEHKSYWISSPLSLKFNK